MLYGAMVGLMVTLLTVSGAYGVSNISSREADILANEVMSKVVYRSSNILARSEKCSLHINFEALNAVFDLLLQGTTVEQIVNEDAILVMNKNMTRTIGGREPESFGKLTLRLQRGMTQPMLKAFNNAIATCGGKGELVAASQRRPH